MFDLIQKIIGNKRDKESLTEEQKGERTRIAAGVVLLEAAHVDDDCTDEELDHVLDILKSNFDISHDCAQELVELAHQERNNSIDLWQFTNQINQQFSKAEKILVMGAVWKIIHADGILEKHEDHFAHKLANLLRLTHREMIEAKLKAKQQM